MCRVHTGANVSLLLAAEKTDYTACHPKTTTTYILHVVSITTHTHDRRKTIGKKKQRTNKKRKERKWVHGAKKKKRKIHFGGLLASLPPERDVTWFFDGLQPYYERLPIHPPKHGLPANYAVDSWPWLSRVSVLGAPVPCLLLALVRGKTCGVLDGLTAAAHQDVRSYDVSFF